MTKKMGNIKAYLYMLQMCECVHVLVTFGNDSHSWDVTGVNKKIKLKLNDLALFHIPHSWKKHTGSRSPR